MANKHQIIHYYIKHLCDKTADYEFYQAVRLIKRYLAATPGRLEYKLSPSLNFPVSECQSIEMKTDREGKKIISLGLNFIGLIGQSGVLPNYYLLLTLKRMRAKDNSLFAFVNFLQQKLLDEQYRFATLADFFIAYENKQSHQVTDLLLALTGQASSCVDEIGLKYAGLFSMQVRSQEGLRLLLSDYFELPIKILPLQLTSMQLSKQEMTYLKSINACNHLGIDTYLGQKVYHTQRGFTIVIGPLDYPQCCRLFPGENLLGRLQCLCQMYIGEEYIYGIKLKINLASLPPLSLSKASQLQLGRTTRLLETSKKYSSHQLVMVYHNKKSQKEI
ncbi:MAG: type VI secretion system baseplate subunit TssG [Pseudomonadota bacterium]